MIDTQQGKCGFIAVPKDGQYPGSENPPCGEPAEVAHLIVADEFPVTEESERSNRVLLLCHAHVLMERISGYRNLNPDEIRLVNAIKATEVQVGQLWRDVTGLDGLDRRWAAVAKTDLQTGFMALVRSITQPDDAF